MVDFGCGNAYLTFAAHHFLREIKGIDAHTIGVDRNAELIKKNIQKAESLQWSELTFQTGDISDFQPEIAPDIVIALHACDTATDDAIAKGINWSSKLIIAAPCCQHDLQKQLSKSTTPLPMRPLLEDGIVAERLGDILTDTFRALILRATGYSTVVMEFVSTEHTSKNLLIQSVKTSKTGNPKWIDEYILLKHHWMVNPYLERLLNDDYSKVIEKKAIVP